MRPALAALTFLALVSVIFAADVCVECATFANASAANMNYNVDQFNKTISVYLYYENFSSSPSRLPINNTIVIIELTNTSGLKEIYKVYSDNQGQAVLDFSARSDGCLSMKVLYCPFCNPGDPACGFAECLRYAKIHNETAYYDNVPLAIDSADDIPDGTSPIGAPGSLNAQKFLPELRVAGYCAPPPPFAATPPLCLPMLIIFSLLGGALYLTGRNPFMGFNIGGARVGRHIRYQARGRGFSLSVMSVVSAAQSIAGAAKALAKGGGKELAKQESAAAQGRYLGGDLVKGLKGVAVMTSSFRAAGKHGGLFSKKGGAAFSRHFEARMGSGSGGQGPQQQQQSGSSMAMTPGTGGGIRASELTVSGNYGAQVFGSLGKMMVFFAMNTTLGRCVDGLVSLGQGWTENSRERGLFEMMFVSHSRRAQEDLGAMRDMMVTDEHGGMRGMHVTLPGGAEGVVRGFETRRDGSVEITLEPAPGSLVRGDIKVTVAPSGAISSMEFTIQRPMEIAQRGADGQPLRDAQGRTITVPTMVDFHVTVRAGGLIAESTRPGETGGAGPQFYVSVDRNAPAEVLAAIGQPNLQFPARGAGQPDPPIQVRVDSRNPVFTVGSTAGGAPITLEQTMNTAMSGSALHVGGNASDLMDQCKTNMGAMREMQQSFQREIGEEMRENRQRVESLMTDDAKRYLGGVRERQATSELALTLGVREEQVAGLISGLPEGERLMGGRQGAAVIAISDAYRSSELGAHDFVPGLLEAAGGVNTRDKDRDQVGRDTSAVQGVLSRMVSSGSIGEISGMDAGALRTRVVGDLTTQVLQENPGMTREVAGQRAEQLVSGMNFQNMDRRIDQAVDSFQSQMRDRGFSGDLRSELGRVDISQISALASYGAPTWEGGRFQSPSAMLQDQGRVETAGGRTVDTYQISPDLRSALNEHAHLESMYNASQQVAGSLAGGRFSTSDVGQLQFMQQQNARFADAVIVSAAQAQGSPERYGVAQDLNQGTSDLARSGIYGSQLPHPDEGTVRQREEEERRAREDVHTAVVRGDLTHAQAIVNERLQTYTNSGNQAAVEGWDGVAETIRVWRQNPDAYQAARGDASGMALSIFVPDIHPAGEMQPLAQRGAQSDWMAQQDTQARGQIVQAFENNDYRTAEAVISQQIRHYRQIGDERTALAYDVALIQVSGLRREFSDDIPGSFFTPSFRDQPETYRIEQREQAEQRVLQDIGVRGPTGGILGEAPTIAQRIYDRVGQLERDGDVRMSIAADRVNEQVRGGGRGSQITDLSYGRAPPPAE